MIKVSYFDIIIISLLLLFLSTINNTIYLTKEFSNRPLYNTIEHMNDEEIKEIKSNIQKNTHDIQDNRDNLTVIKLNSLIIQSQNKIKELTNTIKNLTNTVNENKNNILSNKNNIKINHTKLDEIYNFKMNVKEEKD